LRTRRQALGQHFLNNPRILERIVRAVAPGPGETVIEIGPGHGSLTRPLAAAAGRVVAIERDAALVAELEAGKPANVAIVPGDALRISFREILAGVGVLPPVKIAGNLPYSISGPFLARFWEEREIFLRGVFLIQREVAERIAARPGGKDYAPLSILLQIAFEVKIVLSVAPGSFSPPPKVDSAVIVLDRRARPVVDVPDPEAFRRFLNAAFAHRRKTLVNNLAASGVPPRRTEAALDRLGLESKIRPEEVAIPGWAALFALRPSS
jgi:16S rRNA (adenine1518-N6/adenine1519-N6)-dimethyltransferase